MQSKGKKYVNKTIFKSNIIYTLVERTLECKIFLCWMFDQKG